MMLLPSYGKFIVRFFSFLPCDSVMTVHAGKERHLPKPQRRGAIIVLGMLAVAKRSVLTDKVDVMLKIGLGPLGRVRIIIPCNFFLWPDETFIHKG